MKKLIFVAIIATISMTGCSFSVSTGGGNTNTTASPSPSAAQNTNKPAQASSPTAKPEESAKPAAEKSSGESDPKSEEEHIKFAAGKTESTIERTIAPGVNKMYLFTAKKDQTISLRVDESTGELGVSFNKQPVELGVDHTDSLNASGEWAIYVDNPTEKPLKYKLSLGIQ